MRKIPLTGCHSIVDGQPTLFATVDDEDYEDVARRVPLLPGEGSTIQSPRSI
jgi:hypothetical protein